MRGAGFGRRLRIVLLGLLRLIVLLCLLGLIGEGIRGVVAGGLRAASPAFLSQRAFPPPVAAGLCPAGLPVCRGARGRRGKRIARRRRSRRLRAARLGSAGPACSSTRDAPGDSSVDSDRAAIFPVAETRPCGRPPDTAPGPAAPGLAPAPATWPRCTSCSGRRSPASPLAGSRSRRLADAPGSSRPGRGSSSSAGPRAAVDGLGQQPMGPRIVAGKIGVDAVAVRLSQNGVLGLRRQGTDRQ